MLATILADVTREALQEGELDAVLQAIVDCVARRLPVSVASILLLDESGGHFEREVISGAVDLTAPVDFPWPVSVGAAGRCVRSGEPQLIADPRHDPDYVPGHSDIRAEYLVPIRHRRRLEGVLNLESMHEGFFAPSVCAVFDAVADQIAGVIHLARVASELEAANRQLQRLSFSDGLTGIANRRCFDQQLEVEWRRSRDTGQPLALLLVDADCFKALNDARGHLYGDHCLRELAGICGGLLRSDGDLVARFGGEEIALLLPDCRSDEAQALAETLRQEVAARALAHPSSPVAGHVTVSVGVAAVTPDGEASPLRLVDLADRALYRAKARGRNRVFRLDAWG
ncbi:MAG: diguanylate cyclase [Lysobacteraceae bacterium]